MSGFGFADFLLMVLLAALALSVCAGAVYLTVRGLRRLLGGRQPTKAERAMRSHGMGPEWRGNDR